MILTWFLEKHINMPPVGEINYTQEDDSHLMTKTLKLLKSVSNKTT